MSKKRPKTKEQLFNEYKSGRSLYKACQKSDKVKTLRYAEGSHFFVETFTGETQTIPLHKELGTSLRWKLIKWCIKVGIIGLVLAAVYLFLT